MSQQLSSEASLNFHVIGSHIANLADIATTTASTSNGLMFLLNHFESTASLTLSSRTGRQILRDHVPQLIRGRPVLFHSILAFSSAHLTHLRGSGHNLRLVSRFHASRALGIYASKLRQSLSNEEIDAMFAACLMLTGLFFMLEPEEPRSSWIIHDGNTPTPHWITMLGGLGVLLQHQRSWDSTRSCWQPFLAEGVVARQATSEDLAHVPEALLDFCVSKSPESYLNELQILGSMMRPGSDHYQFARMVSFPTRFTPEFTAKIYSHDTGALLILSYWFALLCSIPHWWVSNRVRHECRTICQHLQQERNPRLTQALQYPLRISGIGLRE